MAIVEAIELESLTDAPCAELAVNAEIRFLSCAPALVLTGKKVEFPLLLNERLWVFAHLGEN